MKHMCDKEGLDPIAGDAKHGWRCRDCSAVFYSVCETSESGFSIFAARRSKAFEAVFSEGTVAANLAKWNSLEVKPAQYDLFFLMEQG